MPSVISHPVTLKDVRAVPILVPLLRDEEVNLIVPWSLQSAIPPLIEMLGDSRLEMRAAVLRALEKLEGAQGSPSRGDFGV